MIWARGALSIPAMYGDTSNLDEVRQRLNSVSPCFCLAKWKHVTIHLLNGTNHSCYLPPPHKIPLEEIARNPSALHNSSHKKQVRKDMLEGRRPKECGMCWTIEDLPGNQLSDRIVRGTETWTKPYFDEVRRMPWDADVFPAYMEVSFSSICNFKCSYCAPHVSTKWHEEIKQHGPYELSARHNDMQWVVDQGLMPIEDEDNNPYIEAFWKWWPDVYPHLKVFRVTGGEPLLSKHTFRVLDWIDEHPHAGLELDINSNLGVPTPVFERFLARVEKLTREKKIRHFKIHTSLDNFGAKAEYIRHGLDFERFQKHVHDYLTRLPQGDISFMSTFNILSVDGYERFLDWMIELREQHQKNGRWVNFDIPHLTGPMHLSARILTPDYQDKVAGLARYIQARVDEDRKKPRLRAIEFEKMRRIHEWMRQPLPEDQLRTLRHDFYLYFREHDRRRGTDFLATFPEMKGFWEFCRDLGKPKEPTLSL
ncbi:MAG: twitch domain-containing radical SAM protein [Bdellovibrionaceae bacterium]|nr:twitch domain-containing radical SAM protein [Pseudobdellovibrionaceae bacterium]